jgi:ABC-type sugar transport system substrate-binding protein
MTKDMTTDTPELVSGMNGMRLTRRGTLTAASAATVTAIFITPADAAAISPAVQEAVKSGIPLFVGDSYVPNATVTSTTESNNPELDAIWCAWDGAASEGALAIRASGRDVMITGIDGGQQSFEYIAAGSPFKLTMAQSCDEMAYMNAFYAVEVAQGRLTGMSEMPDTHDQPGEAAKLGWSRTL